jgi:hypothetical protein
MMRSNQSMIPVERIERSIYLVRGQKVMLDMDLAKLYEVPTKRLNEQVRRNERRFPVDFMFQLTVQEIESLRSQFATLKPGRGKHRKYRPYAFTEQGVAMLSSVLNSDRAVQVNIEIMRARRGGSACEKFCHHIKTCHASWRRWKRNTTSNSEWSLMPSVNSCGLYSPGVGVSVFMWRIKNEE